jgi:predicted DNA-binding transcriptional regulator AlpA
MPAANEQTTAPATLRRRTLADYLDRSLVCIDRDNAAARIPAPVKIGGALRWLKSEIDAWLEAGAPDRETWERFKKASRR